MISKFEAFNINSIPRFQNQDDDLLSNISSKLIPSEYFSPNTFSIELIFRPSILDSITNWCVFDDNVQVLNLLINEGTFKDFSIDDITHDEEMHKFLVIQHQY